MAMANMHGQGQGRWRRRLPVWTAIGVTAAMALGGVSFAASAPVPVPPGPHGPGRPGHGLLHGVITAINGGVLTLQRQGPGGSGTLMVDTTSATAFRGGPGAKAVALSLAQLRVGDRVAVRGTLSGSTVSATAVDVQPAPPLTGVITAINGGVLTLQRQGPGGSGTLTVDATSATAFRGGPGAKATALTLAQLRVGERVMVRGTLSGSTVSATAVAVQPAPPLTGVITAINGGVLTLQRQGPGGSGTLTVDTTSATAFRGGPGAKSSTLTLGALRVGERVMVRGTLSGSTVSATALAVQPAGPGRGQGPAGRHPGGPGPGLLHGVITAINGGVLTLQRQGPGGSGTLTVDTTSATVFRGGPGAKSSTLTLGALRVGERVMVRGTLSGSTVSATAVAVQPVPPLAGVITAINGGVLTLQRQGPGGSGTLTVDTTSATAFRSGPGVKASALTLAQLHTGERVMVRGTLSGSTVGASVVSVQPGGPPRGPGGPPLPGSGH